MPRRLAPISLLALAAALLLALPSLAQAQAPKLVSPKAGAVLPAGSEPVFKVRDRSSAARKYRVFITISTTKERKANGDLKRTKIGNFASTTRKGTLFSWQAPDYSFPDWFMVRPGTYYWQAFHIDCRVRGCHVHSKVRSFRVQ